jgi:predicted Rossmann fold flavoprotein
MVNKETIQGQFFDVIVVGGGPAGMMSAGRAGERGLKVLLLEKNDNLGKKLLITGGGRCNVTNAEFDNRIILEKFKDAGKFLHSTFAKWNVQNTLDFFHNRGVQTKIEAEKRVFPVTDKAESIWKVMVEYIKHNNIEIMSGVSVTGFLLENKKIIGVMSGNKRFFAKNIILATGGKSHPYTGSTGEGFDWLKIVGHKIIEPSSALVPISIKEDWISKLAGVTLTKVRIDVFQEGIKHFSSLGKVLFTHTGLSGPTILNMSKDIGELLKWGDVFVFIDLLPDYDYAFMNTKLQEMFLSNAKKKFKNSLDEILSSSIASMIIEISKIDPDKKCADITREERIALYQLIKNFKMQVSHLLDSDKAIVTSGGVSLEEVDFRTMQSKIHPNLYLVGDILNIDRPSGGYSLQLCWSTGFVAGDSVTI